jgi:hypothetical protein
MMPVGHFECLGERKVFDEPDCVAGVAEELVFWHIVTSQLLTI